MDPRHKLVIFIVAVILALICFAPVFLADSLERFFNGTQTIWNRWT